VTFVTEMYEVYVDVEKMDQPFVAVVVVVVDIMEYYAVVDVDDGDDVKVIVYAVVVVEVDIEMQLYRDEMFVEYVVENYSVVLYNILVQNIFPHHLNVEDYSDQIWIN
jgi:hypothetical protein